MDAIIAMPESELIKLALDAARSFSAAVRRDDVLHLLKDALDRIVGPDAAKFVDDGPADPETRDFRLSSTKGAPFATLRFRREVAERFDGELRPLLDCAATALENIILRDELATAKELLEQRERDLSFHVLQYRSFISQSSEGMSRFDAAAPLPLSWPIEDQIDAMFEFATLAECNASMARMYGYDDPAELLGAPLKALLPPEDPRNAEFLNAFIRNGYRITDHETYETTRAGERRVFSNNLVGIVKDDCLMGAWGTQRDVTEQKRAREALELSERRARDAAEEARLASQAKSRFLANMSHEIRTPLGIIMGFADLALTATEMDEVRNCLEAIKRNGLLLSQIIGDVLDFSKIEASRLDVERASIPLAPVLADVQAHLGFKASQKGIDLWIDSRPPLPERIFTDAVRLRQILFNVVGNAIKFTSEGRVGLRVMAVSPLEDGRPVRLRFEVEDTGIGIPERSHKDLFQPFMQVDASTTRKFNGTGLGLMLSRQLAQALGGDLELVRSRSGEGSLFAFEIEAGAFDGRFLPVENIKLSPCETSPDGLVAYALRGLRILVVDDSSDNQLLIHHYLTPTGSHVDFAANGAEALRQAERDDYDVILMDLQMPVMDGNEATRRLREAGFDGPIFALTAHALQDERERALRDGFNEFLTKPLQRATLLDALSSVGRRRRQRRTLPKVDRAFGFEGSDDLMP